jgi:HK97 family phage major capsid protein
VPNAKGDTTARLLTPAEIIDVKQGHNKALIDDSTSGGENAVPEFFDTDLILLPILGGEISPLCNMVDVPRGSSADTFTMGNVTISASTEGSAFSFFSTSSFIANHDTTFFRAMGAIEVGLNFLADAVPGLADEIVGTMSRKTAEWLDQQIATGDGTTEPQGLTVASGTVDITPGTPTTGPWVISDVLNLMFGVTKAFRTNYPSSQAAFVMDDSTYKRIRSVNTGVTGDTRLIFGNDVESYTLFGHPVAIEENGLTGADAIFAQLGGYRLYRRQGLRFRRETAGETLALKNTMAIIADSRWGGQLDRGGYAAVIDAAVSS